MLYVLEFISYVYLTVLVFLLVAALLIRFLNIFIMFSFMLDSGGGLWIRSISATFLFLVSLFYLLVRKFSFSEKWFVCFVALIVFFIPSFVFSISKGVLISEAIVWVLGLLLIPVFIHYFKNVGVNTEDFGIAGFVFSLVICFLFFGRLSGVSLAESMSEFLKENSSGFFGDKNFGDGVVTPNVYFQGTLAIVPAAIVLFCKSRYILWLVCLLALALAPSRFGVLVVIFFAALKLIFDKNHKYLFCFSAALFIPAVYFSSEIPVLIDMMDIFSGNGSGVSIRAGHLDSIITVLNTNLWMYFIGQGPGTYFYSSGFGLLTNNVEISQFEVVRKFGFIFFIFIHFVLLIVLRKLWRFGVDGKSLFFAVIGAYIVSFSNPVLLSFNYCILFSICLCHLHKRSINGLEWKNIKNKANK